MTSGDGGDSPPLPWTDDRDWIDRLRRAGSSREHRVEVVLAWGRAAGGTVQDGAGPALVLPVGLPRNFARVELERMARGVGVAVEVAVGPAEAGAR